MKMYIINGEGFAPDAALLPLFTDSRREKLERLQTAQGREQSCAAEIAYLLARPAGGADYFYGENGKPEAADGFLSLSHAGSYGLCAWASEPVGADIERESRNLARLARRLFAPGEADDNPLLTWCAKESYVKLTGEGLSKPFPSLKLENGVIFDSDGRTLARVETGLVGEYRWCVCARGEFTVTPVALSVREAAVLLREKYCLSGGKSQMRVP